MNKKVKATIKALNKHKKVLIIATSNRWTGEKEKPKSTLLGELIAKKLGEKTKIIDASKLFIVPCEGNVSGRKGNHCGVFGAKLKDKKKNPSDNHRCWASINNNNDELWKITKELFESEAILFLGSIRWGSMNSIYQKLIERLTFIENRHTNLGGENLLKNKVAGIIAIGQNWNGAETIKKEKQVLKYFGFKTPKELSWNWQYTKDSDDESEESYQKAFSAFKEEILS